MRGYRNRIWLPERQAGQGFAPGACGKLGLRRRRRAGGPERGKFLSSLRGRYSLTPVPRVVLAKAGGGIGSWIGARLSRTTLRRNSVAIDGVHASARLFPTQFFQQRTRPRILAARNARALLHLSPSHGAEGAGKAECRLAPAVHCARNCTRNAQRHTGEAGNNPAFPAQWVDGLCRDLPGDEFLLSPSPCELTMHRHPVGSMHLRKA